MELSDKDPRLKRIVDAERVFSEIQDVDILLESILSEARNIVNADAGSIYVVEDDLVKIRYAQNDTQQKLLRPGQKLPFKFFSYTISPNQMCGYSALTNSIINEDDVYAISPDKPYSFNKKSDMVTGYRTKSVCTIPLNSRAGSVLGVLQIINPMDKDGNIITFSEEDVGVLGQYAVSATQALERAYLTREMVFRMVDMVAFRDPKETGAHVNRVANYAVELYDRYAFNHNIPISDASRFRDTLKIAAMLHDVGKIGISDTILKKPGRFNDEEYALVKGHTCIGGILFKNKHSEVDEMSCAVALRHHERWDGTGYPGKIPLENYSIENPITTFGEGLKGEEIPLAARIVAVADVFDALSSVRVYKPAWDEDDVLKEMHSQAGTQFDPELIDVFFEVLPRLRAIQAEWKDN
ncbi:MAG: HD domain-containing protein [Treponemataceae bacterium]|nr:HD domain-containing protein [Treponemataceae bacterium]